MVSNPPSSPIVPLVQAALEGVVDSLPEGQHDRTRVLFTLEACGDALRASLPLPPPLRRWLRDRRDDELGDAVQCLHDEVTAWPAPTRHEAPSPDDFVLRRRDQAASALEALAWRFIAAPPGTDLSARLDALDAALVPFDRAVATQYTRGEVEALLGDRRFLDDPGWRATLPGDAADTDTTSVEPGVAFVDAWLREGRFSRFVQQHAARDADFAARLQQLVELALEDASHDRTLPVGFVARRWLQTHSAHAGRPVIRLVATEPVRLAAATAQEAPAHTTLHLGLLSPLPASATLDHGGDRATLTVYADPGVLARLSYGGVEAPEPSDGATWRVTLPASEAAATAVVEAKDGERVEFDVAFDPHPTTP
jgi:hypothetical protein